MLKLELCFSVLCWGISTLILLSEWNSSVYDGLMSSFVPFSIIAVFPAWKMGCTEEAEGELYANWLDQLLLNMLFLNNKWR